jgi:hypothetical protein
MAVNGGAHDVIIGSGEFGPSMSLNTEENIFGASEPPNGHNAVNAGLTVQSIPG